MHDHLHSAAVVTDPVERALQTLHGVLPDQAPIGVFIHHNTLHALQHLPFDRAVREGAALLGARAYPRMSLLRAAWRSGRIEDQDVDGVLPDDDDGAAALPLGLSRRALRRVLLRDDIDVDDGAGAAYASAHDPLFVRALALVSSLPPSPLLHSMDPPARHRDALLACGAGDVDDVVHPELVRLGLSFLDLGQARVRMPGREQGFLFAAATVLAQSPPRGAPGIAKDAARVVAEKRAARDVIKETLTALGVDDAAATDWLVAMGLALRGVAGMFSRFERHPEEADAPALLVDCLAIRLLLERRVIERLAKAASLPTSWTALQEQVPTPSSSEPACAAFLLAGLAKAAGHELRDVVAADVDVLLRECAAFPRIERNRVLFLAFERAYRRRVLGAMVSLQQTIKDTTTTTAPAARPPAQVMFCIDEREESVRRAIEEIDPRIETFGVAGFFGMAIDYLGIDDHAPAAYCPVVVTPAHEVHESPVFNARQWHRVRARLRTAWHAVERGIAAASRSLVGGAGASVLLGPFAGALATSRVIAPRGSLRAWQKMSALLAPTPVSRLLGLRAPTTTADEEPSVGKALGFSLDEAADRVTALLRSIGLVDAMSRVVVVLGHGSTSLNNPHESAHDCGACGGRRGGANARLFASLANRADVRAAVKARGVAIPTDTWFIGGLHDTANDGVVLSDLERVPPSHTIDVEAVVAVLDQARQESARERCRRFLDAPLGISRADALAHVETRASHLGQPRPEYGHCTNASCVVGRRALTRGLHLDRRAFLVSYDPAVDVDDGIIERILAAVGPVGAGISLEYYFSSIDNEVYGCGTKLPHNVTGLLGVMNGHQGDLRTGLPLQMVELHEPMRLLLIVEASPEALLKVAGRQAEVRELVVQDWVQLVSVHPQTGAFMVFQDGAFVPFVPDDVELPAVERSIDWHGASRDYVGPALVRAALGLPKPGSPKLTTPELA